MLIIYIIKISASEIFIPRANFRENDLPQKLRNRFEIPWNLDRPSAGINCCQVLVSKTKLSGTAILLGTTAIFVQEMSQTARFHDMPLWRQSYLTLPESDRLQWRGIDVLHL